jgi:hypothetical protein
MGWVERQLPRGNEIFLDHVGFFVEDIEAAGLLFERLGFTVTPVNIHYNADADGGLTRSGTANRLSTFSIGYIEVLGAVVDTPLADQLNAALSRYVGLHLIAFTHPDMEYQAARLAEAGFDLQPPVRLRRPIETPEGEKTVRVTVVRTKPGVMTEGRVQMLTHETPELIWLPAYSHHLNRVDALSDLLLISEDADKKAALYGRYADCPVLDEDGLKVVSLSRGRLSFSGPDTAASILPELQIPSLPCIAAVALRSADLNETRRILNERDVTPLVDSASHLIVGPQDGVGAYIVFHAPGEDSVWLQLRSLM